ncbi:hypothetical protein B0H12DRAFT_1140731 [Mycena haematopus]|nr:hypothetical protein B0H12DRAFT_1140731 [Mycena haematopus]
MTMSASRGLVLTMDEMMSGNQSLQSLPNQRQNSTERSEGSAGWIMEHVRPPK